MKKFTKSAVIVIELVANLFFTGSIAAQKQTKDVQSLKIKISFGHKGQLPTAKEVQLFSTAPGVVISKPVGKNIESNDQVTSESLLHFGAGDIDELIANINWPEPSAELRKLAYDAMWGYLLENGSPGQVERLNQDPWKQPDAPLLTVQLNKNGTEGFSVALEQLVRHGAMWLPEHDVFITTANKPIKFKQYIASLKGQRILDRVRKESDASLEQFKKLWPDFGDPLVWEVPWQTNWMGTRGHLTVTAATHGSIYKYAVDRWGNVRPDFASPHKFRLDLLWGDSHWKSQKIIDGLPIIVTNLEKNEQLFEIEQFASPLHALSTTTYGYVESMMLTKVKISGKAGPINFGLSLHSESQDLRMEVIKFNGTWAVVDIHTGHIWLTVESESGLCVEVGEVAPEGEGQQVLITVVGKLSPEETKDFLVKLPSPAIALSELSTLNAIEYDSAKNNTVKYWEEWLGTGAYFQVPEKEVNDLFRANLWHALILPRHTMGKNGGRHMDLPYANTAYGQKNADWPVNQAVYVDYMIYGLRGYEEVAQEEIAAMFTTQQQADGRIGGYANWGVYSPAHLYAIAQNYLLSRNQNQFEQLLPQSLKTLDWCLAQVAKANSRTNKTGLILAPLNDLTNEEREWAFTQAYFVGGLELFGKALSVYQHPRAEEISQVAAKMKKDVVNEFARSSVKSSVVQLADGSWINYVPTDAMTPRRMMDQWYPTDVDTGPLHLSRLSVFDPFSLLTTSMLHDHEDNLFFKNQGAANEPVYVQQATAYLLRDDPKAVIRSFYSLMACGFSHGQLTPLEHRWAWGQYYGPPSTDGAWFEIYRKMLLNEFGHDTLMIGQAIPRPWLSNGKQIVVKKAPTYFGQVSFTINGQSSNSEIVATVELSDRNLPKELLIRFRHPQAKPIRSVVVNGQDWMNYDIEKEYISIPNPMGEKYIISAKY